MKAHIEHKKAGNSRSSMSVVFLRWMLLIPIVLLYITSPEKPDYNFEFLETLAVTIVYNTLITLHAFKNSCSNKKIKLGFFYADAFLLSVYSFQLGGISSEIYPYFFFLIGYCGFIYNVANTVKFSLFCISVYSISCTFYSQYGAVGMNEWNLILRNFFMIFASFGILSISKEVKKFNELHKKEFKLARTDRLTGLANRHYFDQKLSEEVAYSDVTGSPLNIIIFDLDNFKKFNDSYGHVWGDKLLTLFADIIKQNIRKSDIPVRYGGEEFLILIRDLDIYIVKSVADRIRRQLEKQKIFVGEYEERKKVTVSCGIAQYPTHSKNIKEAIDFADKALYHAKDNGKNTVMLYNEINEKPKFVGME